MRSLILASLLTTIVSATPIAGVAILVKNSPITMYEITQESLQTGESINKSADTLIRKKLESLEAKERKISVSSKEIDDELEAMASQNNLTLEQYKKAMKDIRGLDEQALKAHMQDNIRSQKLYSSIAFSKITEPTQQELKEYYQLHIDQFSKAKSFDVSVYQSPSQELLLEQIANPLKHIDNIEMIQDTIDASKINPELEYLLNTTPEQSFSRVIPHPQKGFITFFVKEKKDVTTESLESIKHHVKNAILNEKRNQVLNDYFTRLRLEADIKILRLPKL